MHTVSDLLKARIDEGYAEGLYTLSHPPVALIRAYAHAQRAEMLADGMIALGRGFKHLFGAVLAPPAAESDSWPDYLALEAAARRERARVTAEAFAKIGAGLARLTAFDRLKVHAAAAFRRAAAIAELERLDDRTLRDMGLTRTEIPAAVDGDIYRPLLPRAESVANENTGVPVRQLKPKARSVA